MERTLIDNACVFTGESVHPRARIVIEQGCIAAIDPMDRDTIESGRRIDAAGRFASPGLINTHTHIYSTFARGIPLPDPRPEDFPQLLEHLWWRLDRALDHETLGLSAQWHGLECLQSGVTTLIDHHSSQHAIAGSLATIDRALDLLGLRACLCFEVSDRGGPAAVRAAIEENIVFAQTCQAGNRALRRALFGLHAAFTLSDETLSACRDAVQAAGYPSGFHTHLGEDVCDARASAQRLHRFGILRPQTLCVHGVHLGTEELALLADAGCWIVHCPESNMNNGVGTTSLDRLAQAGIRISLGSDGFTAQMAREALCAYLLQNHERGDPRAGWRTAVDLLFQANSQVAREIFELPLGRLEIGSPADLVLWDYWPPTPINTANAGAHLLFGLAGARAAEVFIDGRQRIAAGRSTDCDEAHLAAACRAAAAELWERF